jgi:diguanylate cyclase
MPIGRVTFSAGVAALRGTESGEDLLHRADTALYRAKEGGRNQVVIDPGA